MLCVNIFRGRAHAPAGVSLQQYRKVLMTSTALHYWPQSLSAIKNNLLTHADNFKCTSCAAFLWKEERKLKYNCGRGGKAAVFSAVLWKEERKLKYNCGRGGKAAVFPFKPISLELWTIFSTSDFRPSQRKYNGFSAFTALGAGGQDKRTWTQPSPSSMLNLHGRADHRTFD